jgi:nucleoside-diphosphate-sugar epimerase
VIEVKLVDVSRLAQMGWQAQIPLEQGIRETYQWCLANRDAARA